MNIVEFLRNQSQEKTHFITVFKSIDLESSPKLLKQVSDRMDILKEKINHSRSREAHLKDLVADVTSAIKTLEIAKVDEEDIEQLRGWREELFEMIDNINYKEMEDKIRRLSKIKNRVKSRSPFMNKIKSEFSNDFK